MKRFVFLLLSSAVLLFAAGCGGSSGSGATGSTSTSYTTSAAGGNTIATTSASNVAPLSVNAGPTNSNYYPSVNVAFTTVVVCAPGTSNCVTIPNVAIDTGSVGLRIPASAFASLSNGSNVLAALQNVNPSAPVAECIQFLDDSYFWGSVRSAEVEMGGTSNNGEVASSVPIHVMGDSSLPAAPSSCSTVTEVGGATETGTEEDTVADLGANGLLGVGNYQYDCDVPGNPTGVGSGTFGIGNSNACASSSTPPPAAYYTCSGSSCSSSLATASQQVSNPVSSFTTDNNGVIVELSAVPVGGQATATGSLVFGIGTESNNAIANGAVVLPIDPNYSDPAWLGVTTVYKGVSYPSSATDTALGSFLDSGSNGIFFLDQPTSGITNCGDWYCPNSTESLVAVNEALGGNARGIDFNVSDANTLLNTSNTAFSDLAGPNSNGTPDAATQAADGYFDWGLPFFYGRNVYVGIWGATEPSSVPSGPFWAY